MSTRTTIVAVCVVGALATLGTTRVADAGAARFTLDGTWTGKITCKSFKAGAKATTKLTPTMRISQSGLAVGIEVDLGTGTAIYTGVANPDATKPLEKGELAIVGCTTNDAVGDDFSFDEIGRMAVKAKIGEAKGTFKGTSLFSRPGSLQNAEAGTCKWSFKRTAADFPNVPTTCQSGLTAP